MVMDGRSRKPLQRALGGGRRLRYYADEAAVVKSTFPDTTFGYNDDGHTIHIDSVLDQQLVYKFPKPITASGAWNFGDACIGRQNTSVPGGHVNGILVHNLTINPINIGIALNVRFIGEDFDCSAITWNVLRGLSIAGHVHILKVVGIGLGSKASASVGFASDTPPSNMMVSVGTVGVEFYGMYVSLDRFSNVEADCSVLGYITNPIEQSSTGRRVWVDFGFV